MKKALADQSLEYVVDEGEGVFYGPKIDVKLEDALGRLWQGPTIQFDLQLPGRFEMTYVGADNQEHTPVMIHRTVLGSLERYIGISGGALCGSVPALAGSGAGRNTPDSRQARRARVRDKEETGISGGTRKRQRGEGDHLEQDKEGLAHEGALHDHRRRQRGRIGERKRQVAGGT